MPTIARYLFFRRELRAIHSNTKDRLLNVLNLRLLKHHNVNTEWISETVME
jgi:hypothetical protein